jgi:hypothetical protein
MIAEFALRSAPERREVREDKCDELRLGELNGNRRCSWAFYHIAHRKWVGEKPERSSPESLTIVYNTKGGYGTRKTRNHLFGKWGHPSVVTRAIRSSICSSNGATWDGSSAS